MKKITIDGNGAVANIAYRFTEIAPIYPITPSSTMAELVEKYAALGEKNLFGGTVIAQQMQSEAGAAGALHGAATGGALATTFTASQGLLLMIPTLYKLAGERLPAVFHVSARSIATHALNIFCDHSDVMACRQTGAIILSSSGVQNAADMAIVAHLVALKCSLPVVHFFDGFRTSHEVNKIFLADEQDLKTICDRLKIDEAISAFRARALNPERPLQRGTAQNEDVFFQHREAANPAYEQALGVIKTVMDEVSAITGRRLSIFEYIGNKTAKNIAAAMGSASETVEEYIAGKGKE
ncbi:MAG: pyruvate:ferredoxin (flavodoxin) oxidoreductase, partial [Clostridia bacterium]|nr:pyruvate:ferredoxin (flavodoxin) oxidoreductase [Clostridia bacterium]